MTRRAGAIKHRPGSLRLQRLRWNGRDGGERRKSPGAAPKCRAAVMGSRPAALFALALCALLGAGEAGLERVRCPGGARTGGGDPMRPSVRGWGRESCGCGAGPSVRAAPEAVPGPGEPQPHGGDIGDPGRGHTHPDRSWLPPCAAAGLGHPPGESHLPAAPRTKRCSCNSWLDKECIYFCHLDIIWVNTPG